jgi:hypothetical protein
MDGDQGTGNHHSDTDTESLRVERGEHGGPDDPRDAMGEVPLAPHSAGILGVGAAPGADDATMPDTAQVDLREAQKRETR